MEVDFLLIGKGLTGQIKRYDYPRDKLRVTELTVESANEPVIVREGANKQVISSQADSLIKISRIWADFFPANTSNQPI
ncbi:hypothetical protein PV079_21250 [Klebsiella pneumoniae]